MATRVQCSFEEETGMSDRLTSDAKLDLKWIYLAWVGVAFASLVIGMISGIS